MHNSVGGRDTYSRERSRMLGDCGGAWAAHSATDSEILLEHREYTHDLIRILYHGPYLDLVGSSGIVDGNQFICQVTIVIYRLEFSNAL